MAVAVHAERLSSADAVAQVWTRVAAGQATLVIDHGVRASPALIPGLSSAPKAAAEHVALLDPAHPDGRWHALLELRPGNLANDLREMALAMRVWRDRSEPSPEELALHEQVGAVESAVSVQDFLMWIYYDVRREKAAAALKDAAAVDAWRVFLRGLGEGPTTVFQDPWFGRLFLGGGAFPFDLPLTLVNLQVPATPRAVAHRVSAIAAHRAISARMTSDENTELDIAVLLADAEPLLPTIQKAVQRMITAGAKDSPGRGGNVRILLFETTENGPGDDSDLAAKIVQLSRLKHARDGGIVDSEVYRPLPVKVDCLHRPDFLKGVIYGFGPFCNLPEDGKRPENLRALAEEGIELGGSNPPLDLPGAIHREHARIAV